MLLPYEIREVVKKECDRFQIRSDLVCAIISVESSGNPKAIRYEKGYKDIWKVEDYAVKLKISSATEMVSQKISWGLMQIMGGVARWHGFDGYLSDLLQPELGVRWGCVHLKSIMDEYVDVKDVISIYNWGHLVKTYDGYPNNDYVSKVLSRLSSNTLQ